MSLAGKKVAILVEKFYEDLELHYPRLRLIEEDAEVHVVGPKAGESYPSKKEYPAKSTHAAKDVLDVKYDCVIIPGGYSPDHMRRTPEMIQVVRNGHRSGAILAAICHGPWALCSVPESIKGRRIGCFHSIKDDVINAGGVFVENQEVTVDGPIITSRVPDDLPAFMKAIIAALRA